ncbi:MAG: hypothetical protein N3A71_00095 [Candidatus Dojkabacteria bacterium]|nr:hypothetical protein [Candidatus Dojkabacteria bacterium]
MKTQQDSRIVHDTNFFTYTQNSNPHISYSYKNFFHNGLDIIVFAKLSGEYISDLEYYVNLALDKFKEIYTNSESDEILSTLHKCIIDSGDFLASELHNNNERLDDVDYSVCAIALGFGKIGIWLDGDVNVRIYRGDQTILVNDDKEKLQFYGSTKLELGDLIYISDTKYLEKPLEDPFSFADNIDPKFPCIIIHHDEYFATEPIEQKFLESTDNEEEMKTESVNLSQFEEENIDSNVKILSHKEFEEDAKTTRSTKAPDIKPENKINLQNSLNNIYQYVQKIEINGLLQKSSKIVKKTIKSITKFYLSISQFLVEFLIALFYKKDTVAYKRLVQSNRKQKFEILLSIILAVLSIFIIYQLIPKQVSAPSYNVSNTNTNQSASNTNNINPNEILKQEIQNLVTELKKNQIQSDYTSFNSNLNKFFEEIKKAEQLKLESSFINEKLNEVYSYEETLFNIKRLEKPNLVYLPDDQNVNIIDIAESNGTIYAIDSNSNQILRTNTTTGKIEAFASDSTLQKLKLIECSQTECYVLDEENGITILNLSTRIFRKFTSNTALKSLGQNTNDMKIYQIGNTVNVYLYRRSQNEVIRIQRSGEGFTTPSKWNTDVGFGQNTSGFAIDGSIYELASDGTLRRFYTGKLVSANEFNGLDTPLGEWKNATEIVTNEKTNYIYVLDKDNSRIVVYEKTLNPNGNKKYQFVESIKIRTTNNSPVDISQATDLIITADGKYLYIGQKDVIYQIIL